MQPEDPERRPPPVVRQESQASSGLRRKETSTQLWPKKVVAAWSIAVTIGYLIQVAALFHWVSGGLPVTRYFAGGFTPHARFLLTCLSANGVVFGPIGFFGAWLAVGPAMRAFLAFSLMRLPAICGIFAFDMLILRRCEEYLGSFGANLHYDYVLDSTMKAGGCDWTRAIFFFSFHADFLLSCYAAGHTLYLTRRIDGPFNWQVILAGV